MNVNFGLFPPVEVPRQPGQKLRRAEKMLLKKKTITDRALADLDVWLSQPTEDAAE